MARAGARTAAAGRTNPPRDRFARLAGWRHPVLRVGDLAVDRWAPVGRLRSAWWESRVWLAASGPMFLALRAVGRRPVVPLGRFGTLVNDARVGRQILVDATRFRTVGPGTHGELLDRAVGPRALLNMDGPEHETMRRALHDLFGPKASREIVGAAAAGPIAAAEATLAAGGEVDLVRLLRVITGRTSYALLGAPEPADGDAGYLRAYRLGEELVAMTVRAVRRGIRPAELERARVLVDGLAAGSRAGWEADGDSTMARLRDLGLSFEEARALIVVIILAGTETLTSGAPRAVAVLLDNGAWSTIDPYDGASLDAAIEATLRLVTPSQFILRSCVEPVEVGGHRFEPGERVFLSLHTMTRTPSLYPHGDPEALRLGEPLPREIRHLWFGAGPHFCIGSQVAREELRTLFGALRRAGELRIVRRRAASGVLFPAYAELVVRAVRP